MTPPNDTHSNQFCNSYSLDSNALNATFNKGLCLKLSDYNTPLSPHPRKLSECPQDNFLNPIKFNCLTVSANSTGAASDGGKDKSVEGQTEIDLSLPYNHYRCLSPSESNLTKCHEGKYMFAMYRTEQQRPGSSRLLRRQFSLDKEDCPSHQLFRSNLDVPPSMMFFEHRGTSPTNIKQGRLLKQCSTSVALDLEKIEEIPISSASIFSKRSSTAFNNKFFEGTPVPKKRSPSLAVPIESTKSTAEENYSIDYNMR